MKRSAVIPPIVKHEPQSKRRNDGSPTLISMSLDEIQQKQCPDIDPDSLLTTFLWPMSRDEFITKIFRKSALAITTGSSVF